MACKLYVVIAGSILADYAIESCKELSKDFANRLPQIKAKLFIYVGFLEFMIGLEAKLSIHASAKACIAKCISAKANVGPKITLTVYAGTALNIIVSKTQKHTCMNLRTKCAPSMRRQNSAYSYELITHILIHIGTRKRRP